MAGLNFPGIKSGQSKQGMIDVDIKPLPLILVGQFESLAASVRSFREPLEDAVRTVVMPSIEKNFRVEGRPHWELLSEQTLLNREYYGYPPGPILQRSKKGKRSAVAFARWKFTKETAFYGASFPPTSKYMPIHQIADIETVNVGMGGFASELPGRSFAIIQDEDQPKIEKVFERWFQKRLATHGFRPSSRL